MIRITLLLFIVVTFVDSRPTHCEIWRGDSQFRCAKDNYKADSIEVRRITPGTISFSVGKWLSKCGKSGVNYSNERFIIDPAEDFSSIEFTGAGAGICNEFFIYDCKLNDARVNCIEVVQPTPH